MVRLLEAYARGAGASGKGVVSAGGTYRRRMTNAVAFGMWFREDGVYPGHNSDERVSIRSLERGMHVLVEAVGDLATGPKIERPLGGSHRRIAEAPPGRVRDTGLSKVSNTS